MTEEECHLIIEVMSVAGREILSAWSGRGVVVVLWSMNLCSSLPLAFPSIVGHSQCSALMEGAALVLCFRYVLSASPLQTGTLGPLSLKTEWVAEQYSDLIGIYLEVYVYVA